MNLHKSKMHVFELQEVEEATHNFSPSRLIGKGSHGTVYRGLLPDGRHVAVKKESSALQNNNSKLINEALILSSIPPNPCIINLIGITGDNKIILTDYMPNGTLHHLLHDSASPPPWPKRLDIALHLAKALSCLHESKPIVVHRDVKSANILFDENWNAKLADFGLAASLRAAEVEDTKLIPAGTMGYIDPSYTTPGKLSTKIDAFSYGVVLLELVSGRKAMEMGKSPASVVEWAVPLIEEGRGMEVCDERMRLSSVYARRAVEEMVRVAARCVSSEESRRPSMGEVAGSLERLKMGWYGFSCVGEMIGWMMRWKKSSRFSGLKVTSGACAEDGGDDGDNISKGRLLVREILADITLK